MLLRLFLYNISNLNEMETLITKKLTIKVDIWLWKFWARLGKIRNVTLFGEHWTNIKIYFSLLYLHQSIILFFSLLSWLNFYDGICYIIVRISREHSNSNYDCDFSYTVAFIIFRTFFWTNSILFKDFDFWNTRLFGAWFCLSKSIFLRNVSIKNCKIVNRQSVFEKL